MNQILFIEKNKGGNRGQSDSIVKTFAIIILIFGIVLISKGVYGIVNSSKLNSDVNRPNVTATRQGTKLVININATSIIESISYNWNYGADHVLKGKGTSYANETIDMPTGSNVLTIKISNANGKTYTYQEEYYRPVADETDPEIEFLIDGTKVKIVAKDDTELSYMKYHWNDEEDTTVEVREDSLTQIEEKISILKGENVLTIVAVDSAGNQSTKKQTFKGAKKPTVTTIRNGNDIVITVRDEENIKRVDIVQNGTLFSTDPNDEGTSLDMQELQVSQPLVKGDNTIVITVYNVSGLSEQVTVTEEY